MALSSDEPKGFTLFSDLPTELQEAIWVRTVDWEPHVLPRPPIPELSVCRQAREVLLKIYRPCFHSYPADWTVDIQTTGWGNRDPKGPCLTFKGLGTPFPRSPYANYSTDILHLTRRFMSKAKKAGSCQKLLFQEAIDKIQYLVTWDRDWPCSDFHHSGPARLHGMPPRTPPPDTRLVITQFQAVKALYVAKTPTVKFGYPASDEDLKLAGIIARFRAKDPDDELMAPILQAIYPSKKILIPFGESHQDPDCNHTSYAKRWMERQSTAIPDWKVPELQYSKMIADPRG